MSDSVMVNQDWIRSLIGKYTLDEIGALWMLAVWHESPLADLAQYIEPENKAVFDRTVARLQADEFMTLNDGVIFFFPEYVYSDDTGLCEEGLI